MPKKPLAEHTPSLAGADAPGEVTFPWDGETRILIEILVERGIGFRLHKPGLTVGLAEGTTEEECRALIAEALTDRLKKTRRPQ